MIVSIAAEPELRAAERPPEERGLARDSVLMLVADPADGSLEHRHFDELPDLLGPADVLVINTSRTVPAALPATAAGAAATPASACSCPPGVRRSCSPPTSDRACG